MIPWISNKRLTQLMNDLEDEKRRADNADRRCQTVLSPCIPDDSIVFLGGEENFVAMKSSTLYKLNSSRTASEGQIKDLEAQVVYWKARCGELLTKENTNANN